MERRTYEHLFCFLSGYYVLNQHHQPDTKVVSIAAVFFKKQLVIAILGLKTLQWQVSKVILFGMYNCTFEAIN